MTQKWCQPYYTIFYGGKHDDCKASITESYEKAVTCFKSSRVASLFVLYIYYLLSIYLDIYKNVTVRLCTNVTQNGKSPKVVHRWRCNLDTTLQANTSVFLYTYYIYIDVKTCFYDLTVKR
jgi:hypothetical protein